MEKIDYDTLPVMYCEECLNLGVFFDDVEKSWVCNICGGTSHRKTLIHCWEDMFRDKYGIPYTHLDNRSYKQLVEAML